MNKEFKYDVFLSYSSKDNETVHALAKRLKNDGLAVWLDAWAILPGDSIPLKIQHGLEQSRTLLMCMSSAYFDSEWGTLEHQTLLFRDPSNAQRRFIPLLIEDCTRPDIIAQFAYIDWRAPSDDAYAKLLASCLIRNKAMTNALSKKKSRIKHDKKLMSKARMTLKGHADVVEGVVITPDGKTIISGSDDKTLKVWDLATSKCHATFEGHAGPVFGIAITPDGKTVVSGSDDKTLKVWDLPQLDMVVEADAAARYTNAKVVLVGDTGVGKTGLALRLCEDRWEITESTHGMIVSRLELPPVAGPADMEREVWLWDLAGQADYRLVHQLYMDETALGVLVFNPQDDNPFEEIGYWEKALCAATKYEPVKLLAAARCDRGGVTISQRRFDQYIREHKISGLFCTGAKTGDGCDELKAAIAEHIPWERLPWTATSRLFKTLKDAIIKLTEKETPLVRLARTASEVTAHAPGGDHRR